jgi:sterol 3beta-glucosyltransferase
MIITILAAGTRGDTQPYIALGVELKKLGFTVRIATFEIFEPLIKDFGLDFHLIQGDIASIASEENSKGGIQADNPLKVLLSFNKLKTYAFNIQKDIFNACQGSDALLFHPGMALGYFAAQHLKIPGLMANPFPMTPTKEYPALIFYDKVRLGEHFNWITHKIFEKIMWFASSSPVKQFWKQEFGKLPEDFSSPYPKQTTLTSPTLTSCSNFVFPKPADWPEHVYNTGFWFLDEEPYWKPPLELLDFLNNGKPPVYVGFGSIGDPNQSLQTTDLVINALKLSGQRGILATGWSGMTRLNDLPKEIFMLDSVPHAWLFPRVAAVVHHGGAGTTAAGLRAGIPGIIIPFSNDQFAWGRRVFELGVGSKPIPRKKLNAENLAHAIEFTLLDDIQENARKLGINIQNEKGASIAAQIINNCITEYKK